MPKSKTPTKPKKRVDLVKKPKSPLPARSKGLWIHDPDAKQVKRLVALANKALHDSPWEAAKRGEKRVQKLTKLAVDYEVHRETVYVLRRAYHIFQDQLGTVIEDIGLHRLSVLMMAHDQAPELYKKGVPTKRGGRRRSIRLFKTEELRAALRKLLAKSKRESGPNTKNTMKIVRGTKFRSGSLAENLERVSGYLDTGLQQTLTRLRSGNRTKDPTNRPATVQEFLEKLDELVKTFRKELKDLTPQGNS